MNRRAKSMLLKNSKFTGVTDTTAMPINNSHSHGRGKLWRVWFQNQVYNGLGVKNTEIFVLLDANGVYRVGGNWYNYIFIPDEQISEEDAKNSIIGMEIKYTCWSIPGVHIVSEQDMKNPAGKVVLPQISGENIELKVAWQISIGSPAEWYVYVDIVTGEVLKIEQLWVD